MQQYQTAEAADEAQAADDHAQLPESVAGWALFLDLDGTLLDLADRPDAVAAPVNLQRDLVTVSRKVDGALAIISGRSIAFVDRLFAGHGFRVAGLHGVEWRNSGGTIAGVQAGPEFALARKRLEHAAAGWPGVIFEDKGVAIAAHYRHAPGLEAEVRAFMDRLAADLGEAWVLQRGKHVYEIRPGARDKGEAVRTFMGEPPFSGRRPLAIGDDVTDEAMFRYVNTVGGLSVRVGDANASSAARLSVDRPSIVRDWLAGIAS